MAPTQYIPPRYLNMYHEIIKTSRGVIKELEKARISGRHNFSTIQGADALLEKFGESMGFLGYYSGEPEYALLLLEDTKYSVPEEIEAQIGEIKSVLEDMAQSKDVSTTSLDIATDFFQQLLDKTEQFEFALPAPKYSSFSFFFSKTLTLPFPTHLSFLFPSF